MAPAAYPAALLGRIAALCEPEAEAGREACGLVVRRGGALEVVPVENVAGRPSAMGSARSPRDGYELDPAALLRIHRELDRTGGEIVAVWHSHLDGGAHLSARDLVEGSWGGIPAIPGAEQLVLGLRAGRVEEVRRYAWSDGRWVERAVG